jgi:IMP dehydrogenase
MNIQSNENLSLSDIVLVPRKISRIDSRNDVSLKIAFGDKKLNCPIIASPMKDVCDGHVSLVIEKMGGLGIINRFMPIEDQVKEFLICPDAACAIGVNGDYIERCNTLNKEGCRLFCIDVANGATSLVEKTLLVFRDLFFIVGNVASKECFEWLESFPNVIAIRVGIAGGSACTTKTATGISRGLASSIMECYKVRKRALIIADGGVHMPSDMCKSIACGADLVMLGKSIASTTDSPAKITKENGQACKIYCGSASFEVQKNYRDIPRYIEGETRLLPYTGESLEDLISRFCDGLRSSMSYFNAKNLEEYRRNINVLC